MLSCLRLGFYACTATGMYGLDFYACIAAGMNGYTHAGCKGAKTEPHPHTMTGTHPALYAGHVPVFIL